MEWSRVKYFPAERVRRQEDLSGILRRPGFDRWDIRDQGACRAVVRAWAIAIITTPWGRATAIQA